MSQTPDKYLKNWINIIELCWKDKDCRKNFIKNPLEFLAKQGVKVPNGIAVKVHENTDQVIFLTLPQKVEQELSLEVIDALASGWGVLFLSHLASYQSKPGDTNKISKWSFIVQKAWQESDFRAALIKVPDVILKENGFDTSKVTYKVHENTANLWNLTLPLKPERKLTEKELHEIAAGLRLY